MKRGCSFLFFFILLLSQMSYSQTSVSVVQGKLLFESHCTRCHGEDGTKGKWGAKNLQASKKTDEELFAIISKGKSIMPSWEKKLSPEQMGGVIEYIKMFRSTQH